MVERFFVFAVGRYSKIICIFARLFDHAKK